MFLITVLFISLSLLVATPVSAEQELVAFPRAEAADLLLKAQENATLKAKIVALEAKLAAMEERDSLRMEVTALKEEKLALQTELTGLAEQKADHWQRIAESVEGRARREVRVARMQGYAAIGAAVGSAAFPGIGTLVGAALGAAIGFVLP